MAEVYSHIIYLDKKKIDKHRNLDPILDNKISYIENKIKKIDNFFTFYMIKKIKTSTSEKIILIFLVLLLITTFSTYFVIKNECLFVKILYLKLLHFK